MKQKTMDLILILLGVAVVIFTVVMIWLYLLTGAIPDTLCTCFFAACTGECGFMGIIKVSKEKYREREWQLEDEQRMEQHLKNMLSDVQGNSEAP